MERLARAAMCELLSDDALCSLDRLQPNVDTRQKQLAAWCSLALSYCRHHRLYTLDVMEAQESPVFNNKKIERILTCRRDGGYFSSDMIMILDLPISAKLENQIRHLYFLHCLVDSDHRSRRLQAAASSLTITMFAVCLKR